MISSTISARTCCGATTARATDIPTPAADTASAERRRVLREQLHRTYRPGAYDNWLVWAGALSAEIDGLRFDATLARAYLHPQRPPPLMRARCELFVAAVDAAAVRDGEVEARLWTDAVGHGQGVHVPMRLASDGAGRPQLCGANLVLESEPVALARTGAFSYTVQLCADGRAAADAGREWVAINDMAENRDGAIVVSPGWVEAAPTVTEVCLRKVGAAVEGEGCFRSGRIRHLTERLEQVPTDVVYLLPFFKPGFGDLHTGQDVRKGALGSVYAVFDFFQVDPELVTPPGEADLAHLVRQGLIDDGDIADLAQRVPGPQQGASGLPTAADLAAAGPREASRRWGRDRVVQLVGRAELRQLARRAHELGKRVIFDLVLMQTSRDAPLVAQHPEWYVRDEQGRPRIHQIAWLVYSDVALFDLIFNRPLQDYLLEVAPYWMERCELDGVRIDASQTVDRPFLKRLKNRIQADHPEALVLGETLCPLHEAVDIPVDMIYALLVDFHRDAERAEPLIRFLEEMHGTFAAGTVAMAYFENHDSPRATRVWRDRYEALLAADALARRQWTARTAVAGTAPAPLWMALLKSLQATLIDATAGMGPAPGPDPGPGQRPARAGGSQLAWAMEWGSDWGEETRTDFENPTLLHPEQRQQEPRSRLARACAALAAEQAGWQAVRRGRVYYHRNGSAGGDPEDRVLAYTRWVSGEAIAAVHNLDPLQPRTVALDLGWLTASLPPPRVLFDSYGALGLTAGGADPEVAGQGVSLRVAAAPLQSRLFHWPLTAAAAGPRGLQST